MSSHLQTLLLVLSGIFPWNSSIIFKSSRTSSMFIINGLNLLSSFQQRNFTKLVRPKGNCKDINLSVLFYPKVIKSDVRIRWSIYQITLAWTVIWLLHPFPFHYNTGVNSHQRAFSKEKPSIQAVKGSQKMQDELVFHGNGRQSTWTPQERQSSSDSYTVSPSSASCWNFSSLELAWEVFNTC